MAISPTTPTPSGRTTSAGAGLADNRPWWRHGFVWLVISGPAVVVIAGFVTLWIAIRVPDPVVTSAELPRTLPLQRMGEGDGRMAPALAARNHTASTLGATP